VQDIVRLYLKPPDYALVLCVDEKSQIQALHRTQPVLPMGLGHVGGMTHDYVRHGTTTLFAALDIATGAVFTECKPRHRHQEFLISAPPFCGAKGDRIIFGIHVYFSDAGLCLGNGWLLCATHLRAIPPH